MLVRGIFQTNMAAFHLHVVLLDLWLHVRYQLVAAFVLEVEHAGSDAKAGKDENAPRDGAEVEGNIEIPPFEETVVVIEERGLVFRQLV